MLIRAFNKINNELIKEIREVESICIAHDSLKGNIFLDTSLNFNPEIKSLFLLYENSKLLSLIDVFLPTGSFTAIPRERLWQRNTESNNTRPEKYGYRKNID